MSTTTTTSTEADSTIREEAAKKAEWHKRQARKKFALAFIIPAIIFGAIVYGAWYYDISETVGYLLMLPMLVVGGFSVAMVIQSSDHSDKHQDLRRKTAVS